MFKHQIRNYEVGSTTLIELAVVSALIGIVFYLYWESFIDNSSQALKATNTTTAVTQELDL